MSIDTQNDPRVIESQLHSRLTTRLLTMAFVAAVLFVSSLLAILSSSKSGGILVVWPADGLILGFMLGPFRRQRWLALGAGLFGTMLAFEVPGRQMVLATTRVGLMAISIPIVYGLARRIIGQRSIAETRALLPFLAVCSGTAFVLSMGRSLLVHAIWGWPIMSLWLTTWTATFTGCAFATPLVLFLAQMRTERSMGWRAIAIQCGVIGAYLVMMTAVFLDTSRPTLWLIPLSLVLLAHILDFMGIVAVVGATTLIITNLTFSGQGPLSHFYSDVKQQILAIQAFVIIVICATLPITALMKDRAKLKTSLIAALDEAKAASEAKTTFLATMSHEIRTPLNGVIGMAQAIMLDELIPRQRERINVVRNSGEVLLRLLNDVLDISKIEAGKLTIEIIEFNLVDIIDSVVRHNEGIAQHQGLWIETRTDAAKGLYLGDPTRLRQIIQNLVGNALKFTEFGGVTIEAHYDAGQLRLSVHDTGLGVPEDKLSALFNKFSQVDQSTTRRFGGTGLGLSICKELAQVMGGDITVRSEERAGSTFTLEIPIQRIGDAPPQVRPVAPMEDMQQFDLRVLAAEDNATNQLVLKTLLAAVGVTPTIVGDGVEAVTAWRQGDWDLVLMDVQMPIMDGQAATREIRAIERAERRPRTRIVALSANAMDHQLRDYIEAGMDGHLAKPISTNLLFGLLAQVQAEIAHADDAKGLAASGVG
jgi:signal transduction histidine kinase/CheY-like chemotaxis protein